MSWKSKWQAHCKAKGLVVGVANDKSIAWGCARALRDAGAELALTWFNDKARPHVEPLAQKLQAPITLPLDVEQAGQMEAVFDAIAQRWGQLDFVLHSIAFAPRAICTAAWSTARARASRGPWTSPAIPLRAWRIWPSR